MAEIFSVEKSLIQSINDEIARELIARLCRAELREQGLPESAVTWGGDQRAADGGIDVRVNCPYPLNSPNFVKSPTSLFQVKSERIPPSKIKREMVPKGKIRDSILSIGITGGFCAVVSTKDDVSDSYLKDRKLKIQNILNNDYNLWENVEFDFYDSRRIADWIERHPTVVAWIRGKLNIPIKGWSVYRPWAYKETKIENEYIVDKRERVFDSVNQSLISIDSAIERLREELQHPVSVRIVGLSGVGKTRLVQALFDPRVCPEYANPSPENVIYADLADEPEPSPRFMVEDLLARHQDTIVILDNCSPDTHGRITELVKREGSKLKLITIEYDIRDDIPEASIFFRLESASSNLIELILRKKFPKISFGDIARIANFSDGNARVAFALASTIEVGGEITQLHDYDLFMRLFYQKSTLNEDLLWAARAASIIYSFDGEDISANGEMFILSKLVEISTLSFHRNMNELKRRGLLQERGKWRAVLPHAISNRLSKQLIQSIPSAILIDSLFNNASDRVSLSFTRRLSYLHDCAEAVSIAEALLNAGSRIADLNSHSNIETQMFENISPIAPGRALQLIMEEGEDFLSIENYSRSRYIRVLWNCARFHELFDSAVETLLRTAIREPAGYKSESASAALVSIFYCVYPSEASIEQKIKFVRNLLNSEDESEKEIAFKLIDAALHVSNFSFRHDFEFGARLEGRNGRFGSDLDVREWFLPWVSLATELGAKEGGERAREVFSRRFRGLWGNVGLDNSLVDAVRKFHAWGPWPSGWQAVRETLHWKSDNLDDEAIDRLKDLEKALRPGDLISKIRTYVFSKDTFTYDLEVDRVEKYGKKEGRRNYARAYTGNQSLIEDLGREIANKPAELYSLIASLCELEVGSNGFSFGKGVGSSIASPELLLKEIERVVTKSPLNGVNMIWVRGLIAGWDKVAPKSVDEFFDRAISDPFWMQWIIELQIQSTSYEKIFERLCILLDGKKCSEEQYLYLAHGRIVNELDASQITTIIEKLISYSDLTFFVTIDIISMIVHGVNQRSEEYREILSSKIMEIFSDIKWVKTDKWRDKMEYELEEIFRFAIKKDDNKSSVLVMQNMVGDENSPIYESTYGQYSVLRPFLENIPFETLEIVSKVDRDYDELAESRIFRPMFHDNEETVVKCVPKEVVVEWCSLDPMKRYPYIALLCGFLIAKDGQGEDYEISPTALAVIMNAPDKERIIDIFIERLRPGSWSGSLAHILESRCKIIEEMMNTFVMEKDILEIIRNRLEKFRENIEFEKGEEARQEARRNLSFE